MKIITRFVMALIVSFISSLPVEGADLSMSDFHSVAQKYDVPEDILLAVAIIETGLEINGHVTPYPWSVGYKGNPHYFKTMVAAAAFINTALAKGVDSRDLDVGVMQINLHWHGRNFQNTYEAINPRRNLEVAAQILRDAMQSTNHPVIGVGRYHSWNKRLALNYGRRVYQLASRNNHSHRHYSWSGSLNKGGE